MDNARLKAATQALDRILAVMLKLESYRHGGLPIRRRARNGRGLTIREAVAFLDALQGGSVKYRVGADDDLRVIVLGEKVST